MALPEDHPADAPYFLVCTPDGMRMDAYVHASWAFGSGRDLVNHYGGFIIELRAGDDTVLETFSIVHEVKRQRTP